MHYDKKLILALAAAVMTFSASASHADGSEVDALRDRVASLESLVQQLLAERRQADMTLQKVSEKTMKTAETVEKKLAEMESKPDAVSDGETHSYKFGGYVKSDVILSNYSDGDLAAGSAGRDFYIPGTIPVGGEGESTDWDAHAKESRMWFRSDHELKNGDKLRTYVEMDFLLSPGGNERVSNSYNPRLRHAFLTYNNWLFGQTWSTFQNVGALAENLDFVGPAEGTTFQRQDMIRYTNGPWQIAIENPETTVTPFGGGGRIVTDDADIPDFVVRYTHSGDWGNLVIAGLLRELNYEDAATGIDDSDTGFALSVSGKMPVGDKDDFRWMLSGGSGMGRYMGLNTANGAVITADGSLDAIDSFGGFASYRHFWSPKWRSNFTLSFLDIDNDTDNTGFGVTEEAFSAHLNLIYSPTAKLDIGVEYMHASRELASGADGELNRLQFSTKYAF